MSRLLKRSGGGARELSARKKMLQLRRDRLGAYRHKTAVFSECLSPRQRPSNQLTLSGISYAVFCLKKKKLAASRQRIGEPVVEIGTVVGHTPTEGKPLLQGDEQADS